MARQTRSEYAQKLLDPRWQRLRLEVMQRAEFGCECCMDTSSTLHVHHNEYIKGREPWEYEPKQLSCLCDECHGLIAHAQNEPLKLISSYLPIDGPGSRQECSLIIAGYFGFPFEEFIKATDIQDIPYYRLLYSYGADAARNVFDDIKEIVKRGQSANG